MKSLFLFMVVAMLVMVCAPVAQADPDRGGPTQQAAKIGESVEGTVVAGPGATTHTFPLNINISSEDWDGIADSVLLKVKGSKADSGGGANSQGFGVVACDRASSDDTVSISLMRVGKPREIVTSTNDSVGGQSIGNLAYTVPRFLAEGAGDTLYAVLTAPHLNGVADAGWQIGSGGFRSLKVTLLDTFNASIAFTTGCGVTLF